MRISWNELNTFFSQPLPQPEELVDLIGNSFCEIESIDHAEGDTIVDAKILPDRPDAKSAEGFARELSALTQISTKEGISVVADAGSARVVIDYSAQKINEILGLSVSDEDVTSFLNRVRVGVSDGKAYIPSDRTDLTLLEDLADEVMRLYGVDKVPAVPPPAVSQITPPSHYLAVEKIRALLVHAGYSEIYAYSFAAQGEREVEKSLASHKSFLRTNLADNLREKLQWNLQYNLFEQDPVKLFEIGTVFLSDREEVCVAVGIAYSKEKFAKEILPQWLVYDDNPRSSTIVELPLESVASRVEALQTPDISTFVNLNRTFTPFSLYPRIIRDIALFVPSSVKAEEVAEVITKNAGPLLVEGPVKFDEFRKEGEERTSLAFRISFQSHEKSLTDEEANEALSGVISALEQHPNWQVRK